MSGVREQSGHADVLSQQTLLGNAPRWRKFPLPFTTTIPKDPNLCSALEGKRDGGVMFNLVLWT